MRVCDKLKKKISSTHRLGLPHPEGKRILITDASDVGVGGTLYQWQEFNPAEVAWGRVSLQWARSAHVGQKHCQDQLPPHGAMWVKEGSDMPLVSSRGTDFR